MNFKRIFFIILFSPLFTLAQEQPEENVIRSEDLQNLDSLSLSAELIFTDTLVDRPNTAALYSALLPGLGQVYNNKPWKLPIVYGGFVLLGYVIKYNHEAFVESRAALYAAKDEDNRTDVEPPLNEVSIDVIDRRNDYFRRNRDFSIILTIGWYLLNIVDAHVDGHLNEFIITDEITFNIGAPTRPDRFSAMNYGVSLTLNF